MDTIVKIDGLWNEGFAIDKYVKKSEYIGDDIFGHPQFNTTYTPIGELLHSMKYNGHINTSESIVDICIKFLTKWLSDKNIDIIIPISPTIERTHQPVYMITEVISNKMHIPYATNILQKVSKIPAKNMNKSNKNMHGSIAKLKLATNYCNILLVDDLYSTGSTANECVSVLKKDPLIKNVYYLAIAKTK